MVSSPSRVIPPAPKRHCHHVSPAAAVSSTSASTGEAAAVSLPQDIIFEILSWLPLRSLFRSRCVSKEWRALISSPSFVAAYKSRAEPLLIAMSGYIYGRRTMQLMDTEGTTVRVVEGPGGVWAFRASLGDLVCLSSGYNRSGTLVVDLATGKNILQACSELVACATCFGFGRAVQSGLLKVFRLVTPNSGEEMCEVLTLGDGAKWRRTRSPPVMVSLFCYNGVTANGALHFLCREEPHDVLSFDLDNEDWKVIHGPQGVVSHNEALSIAELNGTLSMSHIVEPVINIWLLRDLDKSVWIKAYTMPRDPVVGSVVPLRVLRHGGQLLFYYFNCRSEPKLRVYDPRLEKCTDVKTPANLLGKIGLCSSNLDTRVCGQS